MNISRRQLLGSALATAGAAFFTCPAMAAETRSKLFKTARAGLERAGDAVIHRDVVGIADFSHPSRSPRFYILDMARGQTSCLLVAHGRGSDPRHCGWVERFSNKPGSNATSAGAYLTGNYYSGKHGRSMRLHGLDTDNSNAQARAIVVHGAWYVSPEIIRRHGKIGRSEGCFVFAEADLDQVLTRLGPGRLIMAGKF